MAITQTSTLQPAHHRELVAFTDMYGAQSKLYIHASQVAQRDALIQARVAIMQTNEANMTALATAVQQNPNVAPASSSTVAAATAPKVAQ